MAFDIDKFYEDLDKYYGQHNNSETEKFLKRSVYEAENFGAQREEFDDSQCACCRPPQIFNMEYVAVCNELASFYRGVSRFEESLECYGKAKNHLRDVFMDNSTEYAMVLLNEAGAYRYMGDLDKALEQFKEALVIAEKDKNIPPDALAGLYNNTGLVYADKKMPQQALDYFNKAMELIIGDEMYLQLQGITWNNIANAYLSQKEYEKMNKAVERAIDILSKLNDGADPHYAAALNTKGIYEFVTENYEEAVSCFEKALELTDLIYGKNIEYAQGLRNIATAYEKCGKPEKARECRAKGEEILSLIK